MAEFDEYDVYHIANRFAVSQLRREIINGELKAFLSDYFNGTPYTNWLDDSQWWADYAAACREAITWQRKTLRPATQTPGKRIDIESVKAKSDIVSIVEKYTKLRKSGKRYSGLCPLHADRKSPSLVVYPDQQSFHCYGCNTGGDVLAFVMAIEKTDFRGAAAILGG